MNVFFFRKTEKKTAFNSAAKERLKGKENSNEKDMGESQILENTHLIKDSYEPKINKQDSRDNFSLKIMNNSSMYSPKISGLKPKYFHTILSSRIDLEKSFSN